MTKHHDHHVDLGLLVRADVPVRRFAAGDVIVAEGDAPSEMFVIRTGAAEVRVRGRSVEHVGPGGFVGEMALIDPAPRSAEAVATEPCETMPIDRRLFVILVQQQPEFALAVMSVLARRLRAMDERS